MPNAARTSLLIVLMIAPMHLGLATNEGWGRWQDDGGANVYEFLADNQFRFSGLEKVWVQYRGFAPSPLANLPRAREPRGQYVHERRELSGAWEAGERICTATVPELGKVAGNLKIYAGTVECCMEAKRLGPTLVLRALRSDAAPTGGKEEKPEICVSRALRQSNDDTK